MISNNNIPQGYKQTDLGIIPEDWDICTIEEILDMPTKTRSIASFRSEYYVSTENMISQKRGVVPYLGYLPYSQVREYKSSDILIANIRPYLKKIWMANRCGGCSSDVIVFRVKDTKTYSSEYVYTILSDDSFFKYSMDSAIGTKMPRGDKSAIKSYSFIIPNDIAEQKAIATALSDVDALIAALDKKIAKKKLIKQGAMQQLLTGKKRLPGFTEEWVEKKLEEITDIYQPITISQERFTIDGYNVYGANGIIGKYSDFNHVTDQVMVTCRGSSCGSINMSTGKSWITGNAMVLNMDKYNICKQYVYYYLLNKDINDLITGSGQPQIVRKPLCEYKISIPHSINEQQAIATILSDMDKEISDLEAKRDKYRLIKQGMMQKLLTGQIRLKI